jgi:hypothetical protein
MESLADLWFYLVLAFAAGFLLGWVNRWPAQA